MKKKSSLKNTAIALLGTAMVAVSLGGVCAWTKADAAETTLTTYKNLITYDTQAFTLTEEYEAWGDANTNYSSNYVAMDPTGIQRARLDYGKSGVLLTSKKTGENAENSSFAFANTFYGEFSMDFRVFSEKSYLGAKSIDKNTPNTFLDMRSVGMTFTSATDPLKAFTVYFNGLSENDANRVTSTVSIAGETYANGLGYGVNEQNQAESTFLKYTSFCNVYSQYSPTGNSTTFSFNPETMQVWGTTAPLSNLGSSKGLDCVEEKLLIRDLEKNRLGTSQTAEQFGEEGISSLSADDFSGGYTVTVTVLDMTADSTALVSTDTKDVQTVLDEDGYARTAKILLYNVCGQSLQIQEGFTAETLSYTFPTYSGSLTAPASSGVTANGYRLTANAKNADAEGNTFVLDGEEFTKTAEYNGQAVLAVGALSQQYAPKDAWSNLARLSLVYYGLGDRMLEQDPYSDVKEIGVTFRSKSNADKAFTVYLRSSGSRQGDNMIARVGIEGETYRNTQGSYGFTMDYTNNGNGAFGRNDYAYTNIGGTMGMYTNKYPSVYKDKYANLRFDPATMKIYAYGVESDASGWLMLRDLSDDTQAMGSASAILGNTLTLSAADFADGFNVEISIEQMNTEWNRGRNKVYSYYQGAQYGMAISYTANDGYVLSEGYDRKAVVDVFALDDTATIDATSVQYSKTATYNGDSSRLTFTDLAYRVPRTESIALKAKIADVFGGSAAVTSLSYTNKDGTDTGVIALENGQGTFAPKAFGEYVFTDGKLEKKIHITTPTAPTVSFADGLKTRIYQGHSFVVSENDVVVDSEWQTNVNIYCSYNGREIALTDIDSQKKGKYDISYVITDEGGREVSVSRTVYVIDVDDEAPEIMWTAPVAVSVGESVDVSQLQAYDERDGVLEVVVKSLVLKQKTTEKALTVEDGKITADDAGEIYLTVTATDEAGNTTEILYRILVEETTQSPTPRGGYGWLIALGIIGVLAVSFVVVVVCMRKRRNK